MSADLAVLIFFLVALAVVVVIVGRKIPRLVSLDVTTLPKERSAIVKDMLVARRLERKVRVAFRKFQVAAGPIFQRFARHVQSLMQRVERKEREYQQRARAQNSTAGETSPTQLQNLLASAAALVKGGEYAKAEQQYIEIVGIAPGCAEAFEGLSILYLQQKDFVHAEESLRHAIKLKPNDVTFYLDLADMYRVQEDRRRALAASQQACIVAPNDPKALDAVLDDSIALGDRSTAEGALAKLVATNPDNQKLHAFRAAIAALPTKHISSPPKTPEA